MVAFLEKPRESDGFAEIIDFLKASSVHYALTINPTIYTSCIEQFWATTKVKMVNDVRQIQSLIDKKKLIITEISIRSDLHLEDSEGTDCLPSATIFKELARIGITHLFDTMMVQASEEKKQKSKRKQRKEAEVAHDETEHEESVPTPSNDPQPSGEDSMQLNDLMVLCTKLQKQVLDLEKTKSDQAIVIEDASKQGRRIKDIDADAEMFMDAIAGEKDEQSTKIDDSTAGEAVTTAGVTAIKIDELTLAQTLIKIKVAKPKVVITAATTTTTIRPKARGVVVQDPSEFRTSPEAQPSKSKYKGKAIMIEPERHLKRKDQVALDKDLVRNIQAQLDAEIIEEERLERQKQEEANIALIESWENTQAIMEANRLLAERFQTREREELTDEKKENCSEEQAKSSRKKSLGKKRAVKEHQQESLKRQKLEDDKETDEHEEVEADDTAELKKHLVIKKDDDISINAILLATKPPMIVEYRLLKEGIMVHYQLIRADGSSKRYSLMIRMLQDIDREDLETL
ncbi:hypothetical protein Tco_0561237 [Tanacetum coccineum]